MRRPLVLVILAFAAAAVVSVAIAWVGALLDLELDFSALRTADARRAMWDDLGPEEADPDVEPWIERVYFARGQEVIVVMMPGGERVYRHRAGWPFRCLGARSLKVALASPGRPEVRDGIPTDLKLTLRIRTGARSQRRGWMPMVLPCRPIWVGLTRNAAVYGTGLLLLMGLAGLTRAGVRRLRSRCPGCGYPVGVSRTCTECGRNLR